MPEPPKPALPTLSARAAGLTDDQIALLRALTDQPVSVDDLIDQTQLPARRVLSALTMLEIDQYVTQCSGKRYIRAVALTD